VSPTASSWELYIEDSQWKANQGGTEYILPMAPLTVTTNQLAKFSTSSGTPVVASSIVDDGTDINVQALNLVTSGYSSGKVLILTASTGFTIGSAPLTAVTDRVAYGGAIELTSQGTVVLPAKIAGMTVCLFQTTSVAGGGILKATTPDFFEDMATIGAAAGTITLTTNRNAKVCVYGSGLTNKWSVISKDSNGVTVN
jgi:hypothetical protein